MPALSLTPVFSGIEVDSIQYYNCSKSGNFAVIKKDGKYSIIRYENAAKTVKLAHKEGISLKEACVKLGFLTPEEFDRVFHPEAMT